MTRDELYALATGNYENVKPHLQIIMRDFHEYEKLLEDNPMAYTRHGAFAAAYYVRGSFPGESGPAAAIPQEMIQRWGISMETLHTDALKAMRAVDPPVFENMAPMIRMLAMEGGLAARHGRIDVDPEVPMWVLTSEQHYLGAAYMTDPKILQTIGHHLNEDYYLLPSSIHELICVPKGDLQPEEASQMVYDINHYMDVVSEADRLSDVVHIYDTKKHELIQCEKYDPKTMYKEQIAQEQEKQISRRHHLSL